MEEVLRAILASGEENPFMPVPELICQQARVISEGVQIAAGINQQGRREMLSVEIANSENATTWSNLFGRLKKRGLSGVLMVTSDDHGSIKAAVARHFQGASWQRCQFHFIRNLLAYAAKGGKQALHADPQAISDAADFKGAIDRIERAMQTWICQQHQQRRARQRPQEPPELPGWMFGMAYFEPGEIGGG